MNHARSVRRAAVLALGWICVGPVHGAYGQTDTPASNVTISLQRTRCFGECPVYTVTIDGTGLVVFDGTEFVRDTGRHTARIPPAGLEPLLEAVDRIHFFDLADEYRFIVNADGSSTTVTDLPTTFVTITRGDQTKRVEDYVGAPEGLRALERQIDEAAGTRRWIAIDPATLADLIRDGHPPTPEERAELLRKALQRDEVDAVTSLIEAGADPNGVYGATDTTPLLMVRSAAAARALLAAGANPNFANSSGSTPLAHAASLSADVSAALLEAGARPDTADAILDGPPLLLAACAGNSDVVALLLKAGASPRAYNSRGLSALDCAKNQQHVPPPPSFAARQAFVRDYPGVIALIELAQRR